MGTPKGVIKNVLSTEAIRQLKEQKRDQHKPQECKQNTINRRLNNTGYRTKIQDYEKYKTRQSINIPKTHKPWVQDPRW